MLFKSLPPAHRITILLATSVTVYPLLKWSLGLTTLRVSHFIFPLAFWAAVGVEAVQRRSPSWQTGGASGAFGPSPFLPTWIRRLPTSVKYGFWVFVIGGAMLIDLLA